MSGLQRHLLPTLRALLVNGLSIANQNVNRGRGNSKFPLIIADRANSSEYPLYLSSRQTRLDVTSFHSRDVRSTPSLYPLVARHARISVSVLRFVGLAACRGIEFFPFVPDATAP